MADDVQARRLEQFDRLVAQCRAIFVEKNSQYGDAIADNGLAGVLFEWSGIAGRLKTLRNSMLREHFANEVFAETVGDKTFDALQDKLQDAVNYALIGLMLLEDNNIVGK